MDIISIVLVATGLLGSYLSGSGNRICYVIGLISYLLTGYVAFKNGFYGLFIFYTFIFSSIQVYGFYSWGKHLDQKKLVEIRKFTPIQASILMFSCAISSVALGILLSKIPGQNLAFVDALANCVGLCASILMLIRYREAWWLWLAHSGISIYIWAAATLQNGENAAAMLIMSICFLVLNIRGTIKWSLKSKLSKEI